jgi:arylsulfatase A-like enzyme
VLPARMRALYAAEVTMTDRWLGLLLDRLHDLQLERETVVMLVSDHGFYLGDHGLTGKSSTYLHPELIHVPLVVVDPERRRAGQTTPYFASTHDVGPTLLALAGVAAPRIMDGIDLSPLLAGGRPPAREHAWGGYGNSFYARTDRWALFAENEGRGFHLYDKPRDPGEARNVAGAHPGQVAQLARLVRRRAGGRLPSYPET